jgi:hypothetical protein
MARACWRRKVKHRSQPSIRVYYRPNGSGNIQPHYSNGCRQRRTRLLLVLVSYDALPVPTTMQGGSDTTCRPINTYSGQGVTKRGFIKSDREAHAVIHMSDAQPYQSPDERDIIKKAIKVVAASPEQKLDPMSRLNFSRVHTVNHFVKAMNVGMVHKDSIPFLMGYFQNS